MERELRAKGGNPSITRRTKEKKRKKREKMVCHTPKKFGSLRNDLRQKDIA